MTSIKLAICAGAFSKDINDRRITLIDVINIAKKYSFDAVEIRDDLYSDKEKEMNDIRNAAVKAGIKLIYSYLNRVLYVSVEQTKENCELIKSRIDDARVLGCSILKIGFGEYNSFLEISQEHLKCLENLLNYAKQKGITLCLENSDGDSGSNPKAIKELVEKYSDNCLKTTFDCGNYKITGYDPVKALKLLKEQVGYVHLKDVDGFNKSTFIGNGNIDFSSIISILKKTSYNGYYCFEFKMGIDRQDEIEKSIKNLRNKSEVIEI